jgi:hypothetical protein
MRENMSTTTLILLYLSCALVTVPVTFYISDLFWRFVDFPCVRFARWAEGLVSVNFEEEGRDRAVS